MKTYKQLREELDSLYFSKEEIIAILSDESIDESIREEIFYACFGSFGEGWTDTLMKGAESAVDTATFGQGRKAIAGLSSAIKGTSYDKELDKVNRRMERNKDSTASTIGNIAGDIANPLAGAYHLGKDIGNFIRGGDSDKPAPPVNKAISKDEWERRRQANPKPQEPSTPKEPKVAVGGENSKPNYTPNSKANQGTTPKIQDFKSKESIMRTQRELNKRGANIKVDGIYGKQTAGAVKNLQNDLNKGGAKIKVDGDYGPQTHSALTNQRIKDIKKPKIADDMMPKGYAPKIADDMMPKGYAPKIADDMMPRKLGPKGYGPQTHDPKSNTLFYKMDRNKKIEPKSNTLFYKMDRNKKIDPKIKPL